MSVPTQLAPLCDGARLLSTTNAGAKALWAEGDWDEIAKEMDGAAQELVEAAGVAQGQRVLDVATGTGNVALWAARAGARVMGVDLCPVLLAKAARRSRSEGLDIAWQEADMAALPFVDGAFDLVLSAFGASSALRPASTVAELFRVAKTGATVGVAQWGPEGWAQRVGALVSKHLGGSSASCPTPPPGGSFAEQFRAHARGLRREQRTLTSRFCCPHAWWANAERHFPLVVAARKHLSASAYQDLRADILEGSAPGGEGPVTSPYVIALARK